MPFSNARGALSRARACMALSSLAKSLRVSSQAPSSCRA